ncbi:hypothetical protein WS50_12815 [Burkholderia territorii]|nr:hypothetical protein WS47_30560 [Burkholderia territorii]KUZ17657.1 hypothetical protein WS50_12815 [Burkholderia territorii]
MITLLDLLQTTLQRNSRLSSLCSVRIDLLFNVIQILSVVDGANLHVLLRVAKLLQTLSQTAAVCEQRFTLHRTRGALAVQLIDAIGVRLSISNRGFFLVRQYRRSLGGGFESGNLGFEFRDFSVLAGLLCLVRVGRYWRSSRGRYIAISFLGIERTCDSFHSSRNSVVFLLLVHWRLFFVACVVVRLRLSCLERFQFRAEWGNAIVHYLSQQGFEFFSGHILIS